MKNKKVVGITTLGLCVLIILMIIMTVKTRREEVTFSSDYIMAEELPALLSFTHYDKEGWQEKISEIADGKLSYRELEELLEHLGVREYITYEARAGFHKVPRGEFFQIYQQLVELLDVEEQVKVTDYVFLDKELKEGKWLTQKGYKKIIGGEQYIHRYDMYRAYTCKGSVIGLVERSTKSILWKNVFVHSTWEEKAEILFEQELLTIDVTALTEKISDTICDIQWENGAVTAIYKKEDTIRGTVLSYGDEKIEISGYGALEYSGKLKIYKTYGTVEQLEESKLIIGNLVADFVVAEGKVCGIILQEPAEIQQIRVLLLNGEMPYRSEVYLTANEAVTISIGEKQEQIPANTVIKASDYVKNAEEGYLKLEPETEQGIIFLANEQGEHISLGYQGSLEVRRYQEGYGVVNELSLEDYLCAVVPSEMPASYEREALRAQAICARSYACIQLMRGEYAGFAANVDDSTNYQVYNKQERNEATTLAVQDTVGEVMYYNGAVAEAYYYSTSCGFSQNADVWNMADEAYGYLKSTSLLTEALELDFSNEDVFAEFIKSKEYAAYDSDSAYFRWQAELDVAAAGDAMSQVITERRNVSSDNIQIFDKNGNVLHKSPADLGKIIQLQAEERSSGGVLKSLRIQYEKGSILVKTEYNIRKILAVAVSSMTDQNDKAITNMSLLPSAAFTVIPVETGYVLYGGGYGHGIGLSQNGANGMAKAGFTYTDILQKFYQNIQIENIYNSKDGL